LHHYLLMMRKILLTLFALSIFVYSYAQTSNTLKVKGVIVDSVTQTPLGYVTIALWDIKTHTSVKSTLAKDDGSFELTTPSGKPYSLVLAFIGYNGITIMLKDTAGLIDMGKLALAESLKVLKEVAISAQRPIVKQEVDRLLYDVQADPDNRIITALDMIAKVPMLSVDGLDNIQLRGSSRYKILINGRESALMAHNPADVLKAMPASNIEKIEVITTPPSKYDTEGLAGIINIITKRNTDQGYNGSISAKYQTIFGPGYNANLTMKEGKFGMSAYGGTNYQLASDALSVDSHTQYSPNQIIDQHSIEAFSGHTSFANADLSYEIDSLNLITASLQYSHANFDNGNEQTSRQTNSLDNLTQGYQLLSTGNSHNTPIDATVNYEMGFKKHKNELLTFSYQYSYAPREQYKVNNIIDRVNYSQQIQPNFIQQDKSGSKVNTLQVDYVYPLKKLNIELGTKAIMRQNFSTYSRNDLDSATNNYLVNNDQTGEFNYSQNVYSIYNSYQLKLAKWTFKGGFRLEHTQIVAVFTGTPLDRDYSNLTPSVAIQRSFGRSSLSFGYTQRIQRPGIAQLNPFVDRTNPNFVNTGNPTLNPELNNTFELTYSHYAKGSIIVNLSYAFSNNAIQNVTFLTVNNADTITTTTYQNLGTNRNLGLNLSVSYPITKKLSFSANGRITQVWLKGTFNGQLYSNNGYTGNINTSMSYRFNNDYRLSFTAFYHNGNVTLQGKEPSQLTSYFTGSKMLFNKKVMLAIVAVNPYSQYTTLRGYTRTADFSQNNSLQTHYRYFIANINYRFGRLNKDIKKNQRNINNDDTK
jgi:outer membrane receptor protein involved in Fe transport